MASEMPDTSADRHELREYVPENRHRISGTRVALRAIVKDPIDRWLASVFLLLLLPVRAQAAAPDLDPFAFFQPSVTLSVDDRRQLDRGESIARVLPGQDHEVAVFAAVRVDIDGDRLVAWMRRVEELKKSDY